ncbi:hypothetical protein [Dactylosporangium sp. NPDC006015]|uniref:hypothetical protein n=1 Tax=Dactylosporangium sp. NPDC006015 TaxID=3154576 RepID=UPI0033B1FC00
MIALVCMVLCALGSACGGPMGSQDRTTAVGYLPDGRVLVAAAGYERPASLWTAQPGEDPRSLPFDYCSPIMVLSIFSMSAERIGLTVWCHESPEFRLVALDLPTGLVTPLTTAPRIDSGVWLPRSGIGVVQYRTNRISNDDRCLGVGEVDTDGVIRPLHLTVLLPTTSVPLTTSLPPPDATDCTAHTLARAPAVSTNERYTAFFLHPCPDQCAGTEQEWQREWFVVVHDRITGHSAASPHPFRRPYDLAVADDGALVISARYGDTTGLWYCQPQDCTRPRSLAEARDSLCQCSRWSGARLEFGRRGRGRVGATAAPAHTCVGERREVRSDVPLVRHDLTMDDGVLMASS